MGQAMMPTENAIPLDAIQIRSYRSGDAPGVRWLFEHGLLMGQIHPNDTAADIDNIEEAYLAQNRGHFWVAQGDQGGLVGMVGVAEEDQNLAEIRRLRVDPRYRSQDGRHGVEHRLMEVALAFCREQGYLKVVLDTHYEQGPAKEVFEKFAFQHNRTRNIAGKELLEFYLDLYHKPHPDPR